MKRRFSAILLLVLFSALFACKTQVTPGSIEVQGVVMNKLTTSILVGATETLSVVVTPADAENKAVVWSTSAAAVATVSAEGVVTGLKEGTATITATTQEGGHTATCVVAVSSTVVAVTGVTLNHETATMVVGTTSALAATVVPVAATNQNIDWSTSDATVATVSAQGVVTGLKEGTATITATTQDGGYKTSCVVRVSNTVVAVTGVALNHETATMVVGATSALAATVAPVAATNQDVSWSTSDEAIATVSAEGAVTAVAEGTATITATTQDGGYTATCVVTVSNAVVLVAEVTLDQSTLSIESGSTATLVAAIAPQDATNKNVDWSSSDLAVATVSAEGVVTGVKGGTATITVTTQDGTKTATCEVTVSNAVVLVTGVTLDQSTLSIASGSTATLVAAIAPQDATNKNLDWSTSDLAVATVSTEGVVTAVSEGTATITATTQDGSKTATCAVTVPIRALGALVSDPSGDIAAAGATVTVSSPNAPAGTTWTAELSNTTGFTLGDVTGSGAAGAVPVTVALNPTNVPRTSTLTVTGSNGATSSIELTQAAASLTYDSPSATTPSASSVPLSFTLTGTAGLTVRIVKENGPSDIDNSRTVRCDGSAQEVVIYRSTDWHLATEGVYSVTVTNAGASGLDLSGITIKNVAPIKGERGYVTKGVGVDGIGVPAGMMCAGLYGAYDGTKYTKLLYVDKVDQERSLSFSTTGAIYATYNQYNGLASMDELTSADCEAANYCRGKGMYLAGASQCSALRLSFFQSTSESSSYRVPTPSARYWTSSSWQFSTKYPYTIVLADRENAASTAPAEKHLVRCVAEF